ncbi:metal-sensing transcriptional repressor [Oscillibacter sp. GMB15532]|uniref:metal-sensing transcriptional repressor n=1 Tax=Oscillibacter sp. GMB15532 TaxID=3230022 RepID=UPI0034DE5207
MEEKKCPDTGEKCACCTRHKHREPAEADALLRRLNRIEGQVRGIRGMVEKEVYCTDILTQVSAVQAALNAFARELLGNHVKTCVVEDIQSGRTEVVDELMNTLQKLMK